MVDWKTWKDIEVKVKELLKIFSHTFLSKHENHES